MNPDKGEAMIRAVIIAVCGIMLVLVVAMYAVCFRIVSTDRNNESSEIVEVISDTESTASASTSATSSTTLSSTTSTSNLTTTHTTDETLCVAVTTSNSATATTRTTEFTTKTAIARQAKSNTTISTAVSTTSTSSNTATEFSSDTQTTESVYSLRKLYEESDIVDIAKVLYRECGSLPSDTEKACVAWTILNRVDAYGSTVYSVVRQPNQFAFRSSSPVRDDLYALAKDVLDRWNAEKNGAADSGRVLPHEYMWFYGDGRHNYFRNAYSGNYKIWDYSLPSPYNS